MELTIGLWALMSLMIAMGLKAGWDYSFGAILKGLANAAHVGVWKVRIDLGGPLRKLDDVVQHALGRYILANEEVLGTWWHANKLAIDYLGSSLVDFGTAMHNGMHNLVYGVIPHAAGAAVKPWRGKVGEVQTQVTHVTRYVTTKVVKVMNANVHAADVEFGKAWRGIDHLRDVAIPRLWRGVHGVEAEVGQLQGQVGRVIPHRLTRLEKFLGAGVIGGAAVVALTRVFPYWQCSNVKRLNRLVCRSPVGALDDLLGLAFLALGPISVAEFARQLQGVTDEAADGIRYFAHE
jgi:hypothetical protein